MLNFNEITASSVQFLIDISSNFILYHIRPLVVDIFIRTDKLFMINRYQVPLKVDYKLLKTLL